MTGTMHEHINTYKRLGYVELKTDSGTGSYVLVRRQERLVVKFNQDPAYDQFAEYALANPISALPKIFRHERPLGDFKPLSNDAYTITELELLDPLSPMEEQSVLSWISDVFSWLRAGSEPSAMPSDPHALQSAFSQLRSEAIRTGAGLDMIKGSNYMKRVSESGSRVVITDPFN